MLDAANRQFPLVFYRNKGERRIEDQIKEQEKKLEVSIQL